MALRLSLALLGLVVMTSTATSAPTVYAVASAVAGGVRAVPAATPDLTNLFQRLTIPLGTVPVRD